jgi:16S rRNA (guanine527-N7)-methyltransferase
MTHRELIEAGFDLTATDADRIAAFVRALLVENETTNLTAIRDADQMWRMHICDSLALLPLIDDTRTHRLLDVGTGGGIPGLVLACARPHVHVTMIDATQKKLAAVQRMIDALALPNARVIWSRAEQLAHDRQHREAYDAVTARALALLPTLIEYVAGFVRVGGRAWLPKSCDIGGELTAASNAILACQLSAHAPRVYRLPGDIDDRQILIYEKTDALPPELPRRAGRPRKRPL